jgi:tetratricopeptide (TPR) repeat protein
MSPLYPYTLGALYAIFGDGLTLPRILNALLGALTCGGVFLVGRGLFGRPAGAVAGLAMALYGPAIFYDGQINKTTTALALTLGFAGALCASEGRHRRWIAASGALLGAAALVHENVNLAGPVVFAWLAWPRGGESPARRLALAGIFVAGYAVVVLPVAVRNVVVAGEYVLITSAGGENFYTGNNPAASGRYSPPPFVRPDPFFEHEDFRAEAARRAGRPLSRREASRYWWEEGARFITGSPGRFAWLLRDKFSVFFNAFERPDNFSYDNFARFSRTLALPWPGFAAIAPLALLGFILSARRWLDLIPIYAAGGAYLLSALIFFTQSRYRMPAIPFFCIFAGYACVRLAAMAGERRFRHLALSGAVVVASLLFVTRDPGNGPGFEAQNEAILGELYLRAGRPEEAVEHLRSGIAVMEPSAGAGNPVFARIVGAARLALGLAERERGRMPEAVEALRLAAECPDAEVRRDALVEMARIQEERGDTHALAETLGRALAVDPANQALRLRRARALYGLARHDEAADELRSLLAASPPAAPARQADAWYGLALIRAEAGDLPGTRAALDRVLAIDPGRRDAASMRSRLPGGGGAP